MVAAVVALAAGCSGSGASAGDSGEGGRARSAEAIEADLRAQAAAAGITVPDDLRPSAEQAEAMADERVERFELERQLQAFLACLREAGFEAADHGWDEQRNRPEFGVSRTRLPGEGPSAFSESPFKDPAYLRCYGEHYALVSTAWDRQNLPSMDELRELVRATLECAAEAGVEASSLDELMPTMLEALNEVKMGQPSPLDDTTAKALVACHERYSSKIATANQAEVEQLSSERLR
jgi:hypothetical protein